MRPSDIGLELRKGGRRIPCTEATERHHRTVGRRLVFSAWLGRDGGNPGVGVAIRDSNHAPYPGRAAMAARIVVAQNFSGTSWD